MDDFSCQIDIDIIIIIDIMVKFHIRCGCLHLIFVIKGAFCCADFFILAMDGLLLSDIIVIAKVWWKLT